MALEPSEIQSLRPDALSPAEIEAKAESIGISKAEMSKGKAFALSVLAGAFIGMGGMFMLLIKADPTFSFTTSQLLGGFCFALGLFLVVCCGAELFTGNCLMICGRLSGKYGWGKMLVSWVWVFFGNLVGALALVLILHFMGYSGTNGGALGNAMITVACAKINQGWGVLLLKGVMCNFLVCLAVWISFGAKTITDKFFSCLLPIMAFVACGFEHCVANMFFLPMGLITKLSGFAYTGAANIDVLDLGGVLYNISAATVGNIIGGAVFVGILYWVAYAKKKG